MLVLVTNVALHSARVPEIAIAFVNVTLPVVLLAIDSNSVAVIAVPWLSLNDKAKSLVLPWIVSKLAVVLAK